MLAYKTPSGGARRLIAIVMFLAVIGGVAACSTPSLEPFSALVLPPSALLSDRLTARFMGVSTLMLSDGHTSIMTDGFFSRPGLLRVALGRIGPDCARIDTALRTLGYPTLAAVMVAHAHYDHALDSAVVASRTGAMLIGSASVANIGLGGGACTRTDQNCRNTTDFRVRPVQGASLPVATLSGRKIPRDH
jgi:glyoxylase-like metal-dependent hydrolase (beta-lactamase superfamily II)